ncbi:uncharacterized protein LOC128209356 isoform X2 [Mya arenaria]|uniref:uncharacterized protein LOC128209356 isoform X2 n=1 Tax=Mya arenaria TaxID=6604 RepID=UPI0022DEC649|nr:uncharacterized protein LOC128209356 isoform X2 [Mya arenaria]
MDREVERLFSLLLSTVMEDIGVNSWMIAKRRRSHLRRETMPNSCKINTTRYIFGSQTEGTTTPGMKSDIDILSPNNTVHVALDWSKWQWGKPNLLVLKDELTPPQHCYLQRLRGDCRLPEEQMETSVMKDFFGEKDDDDDDDDVEMTEDTVFSLLLSFRE